jgi:hypothetical protein
MKIEIELNEFEVLDYRLQIDLIQMLKCPKDELIIEPSTSFTTRITKNTDNTYHIDPYGSSYDFVCAELILEFLRVAYNYKIKESKNYIIILEETEVYLGSTLKKYVGLSKRTYYISKISDCEKAINSIYKKIEEYKKHLEE